MPRGKVAWLALTVIEASAGADTLRLALPVMLDEEADIVADPTALVWMAPAPMTETTPGAELAHAAEPVRSFVLLSVYVPVAASCSVVPSGNDGWPALTAIDVNAAGETLNTATPLIPATVAVIVAAPTALLEDRPDAVTLRMPGAELTQVAVLVRSALLPSE